MVKQSVTWSPKRNGLHPYLQLQVRKRTPASILSPVHRILLKRKFRKGRICWRWTRTYMDEVSSSDVEEETFQNVEFTEDDEEESLEPKEEPEKPKEELRSQRKSLSRQRKSLRSQRKSLRRRRLREPRSWRRWRSTKGVVHRSCRQDRLRWEHGVLRRLW